MLKTFSVDTSSEEELLALIGNLKSFLGIARRDSGGSTRKEKCKAQFDACVAIMNCNISSVYSGINLDSQHRYYVYAHLDTSRRIAVGKDGKTSFAATLGMDHFPFYIGKGTGDRAYEINRNETHRKVRERMATFGFVPKVAILKDNLTELEALCIESKLVDIFGLVTNRGRLTNLDEGVKKNERRALYAQHLGVLSTLHRNSV